MEAARIAADAFEAAVRRARADYLEMPGMQLTAAQAARLWHLDLTSCEGVLLTLVQSRFLTKTRNDAYARAA
jgi:hypothetical protein